MLRFLPPILGALSAIVMIAPLQSFATTTQPQRPSLTAKAAIADIGWTKAKVQQVNGSPPKKSVDGNTWYYQGLTVHFNAAGKVDSFPGGAG